MRKIRLPAILPFLYGALLMVLFSIANRLGFLSEADPDRYYHFALSRQMAESGKLFLRQLPQVEGLGWDRFFVEKEFLFHQVTAFAYRLAGDGAVHIAVWVLALAAILSFFTYAQKRVGSTLGFLCTVAFFGSTPLLVRLLMVRPHVLAILLFIWLVSALSSRRGILVGLAALTFTLSYHAFYIPLLTIFAALAADIFVRRALSEADKKIYAWGFGGLVVGILLNPYFPSNLVSGVQIAMIPSLMAGELASVGFGEELYPISSNIFLLAMLVPLCIFMAGTWQLGRDSETKRWRFSVVFFFLLSAIFLWMSMQSKRGAEYFIPTTAFLCVELVVILLQAPWKYARHAATSVLLLVAAWNAWEFRREAGTERPDYAAVAFQSMGALPLVGDKKVFNCEWDTTPYLYYARPNLRFLDIMDPSLLYFSDKDAHKAREKLRAGQVADAYGLIHHSFHADYVLCRSSIVVSQLEKDARFRRLYPQNTTRPLSDKTLYVFELNPEPKIKYVQSFEVKKIPAHLETYRDLSPSDGDEVYADVNLGQANFLNLAEVYKKYLRAKKLDKQEALCAAIKPTKMALTPFLNANYLSVGGGRNIRVWRNGKPLYSSESGFLSAQLHQVMIPLSSPLQSSDTLEFVVCSAQEATYWGFSLTAFTQKDLSAECAWKNAYDVSRGKGDKAFAYVNSQNTCLGPLAVSVDQALRNQ